MIVVAEMLSHEGLLEAEEKSLQLVSSPQAAISADYPWLPNNCGSPAGLALGLWTSEGGLAWVFHAGHMTFHVRPVILRKARKHR